MQLLLSLPREKKKKPNKLNKRFLLPPEHFKTIVGQTQEKLDTPEQTPKPSTPIVKKETQNKITQEPSALSQEGKQAPKDSQISKTESEGSKRVSALSLKSIEKKQQLAKKVSDRSQNKEKLPTEEFTQEQMITHWNAYTQIVKEQGKYNLLSHLTMSVPILKDGMIHLEFPNQTIKLEVERDKFDLLTYMRKKLKNHSVDLVIAVNELPLKRYAYTDKEKYEKLVEKNPNLEALRNAFELDI